MKPAEATSPEDMHEAEDRNDVGYPPVADFEAEHNRGNIHQNVDASRGKNDMVPWMAVSWLLSGLALGMVIAVFAAGPSYVESRVAASVARVQADQRVIAQQADIARDTAYRMKAQLEQKGLIPAEGH